jgi:hypothetical protein
MAEMPRPDTSRRKRVTGYTLGIVFESLWILGMTLFAYLMAVFSMAVFK